MTDDAFIKLTPAETHAVLQDINPALEGVSFPAETATVLAQEVPFYPGYRILEVADFTSMPALQRYVLHRPGQAIVLDGTNEPLYELNRRAPVVLDDQTVAGYVRFFFQHVRGRQGRFILAESVEDLSWRDEPVADVRKAIGDMLTPLQLIGRTEDGAFRLSACLVFRESLFRAEVTVEPEGLLHLSGETLLIENLPVLDDTLGQ